MRPSPRLTISVKAYCKNAQPAIFTGPGGKTHLTDPAAWRVATMTPEALCDGQEEARTGWREAENLHKVLVQPPSARPSRRLAASQKRFPIRLKLDNSPRRPYSKRNFNNAFRIKVPGSRDMPTRRPQRGPLGFIKNSSINSKRNINIAFLIKSPGSNTQNAISKTTPRISSKHTGDKTLTAPRGGGGGHGGDGQGTAPEICGSAALG
jgi:hypothetical protein